MFYLFKFVDFYSFGDHNNSGVRFAEFHYLSVLHSTYKMLLLAFEVV